MGGGGVDWRSFGAENINTFVWDSTPFPYYGVLTSMSLLFCGCRILQNGNGSFIYNVFSEKETKKERKNQ